jgi:hypothetical protein
MYKKLMSEKLEGREQPEDLSVGERIILERILRK